MPTTQVLAVPNTPDSVDIWQTKYVKALKKEWQVHLPKKLREVLSDVHTRYGTGVRMALLLLWVRAHVAAPFWQQWVQQLPLAEEYTACGTAWGPAAMEQLQWPVIQYKLGCESGIKAEGIQKVVELVRSPQLRKLNLLEGGSPEEMATWALQAVRTRTHAGPAEWQCSVLVPYSDMANHSSMAVAEDVSTAKFFGLATTQDIQEGQQVTTQYDPCIRIASNIDLLALWGFVERGNPNDWPYPIQRPLQVLPLLPWDVVLAAAGRLHDLAQLSLQELKQQQQVPLSPGDLASLIDGEPVNRILAAASSLPLEPDAALDQHDGIARCVGQVLLNNNLEHYLKTPWCKLEGHMQEALWEPLARLHIMKTVRESLDSHARQPAAAPTVASPGTPQQRWQAALAALTPRVLRLQAQVGLLSMSSTLEEYLALEGAALAGAFATCTSQQVAQLFTQEEPGNQKQVEAHEWDVESLQKVVTDLMLNLSVLPGEPCESSSSHEALELLQTNMRDWEVRIDQSMRERDQAPRRRKRIDSLQQLVKNTPNSAGAAAVAAGAAGVDACVLVAIQARLQQKMLIHVYGLLCDAVAAELQAKLV